MDDANHYCHNCACHGPRPDGHYCQFCLDFWTLHRRWPRRGERLPTTIERLAHTLGWIPQAGTL